MMERAILDMLAHYECKTQDDHINALKEIIQQTVLLGLWRGKFFEHAAFYGGTALRILHQLNRFSEDLDFSLLQPIPDFEITQYFHFIQHELNSFGFDVEIAAKNKNADTAIQSAFLKANTELHLLKIAAPPAVQTRIHSQSLLKVKLEIDTLPPPDFNTEAIPVLRPIPFWVKTYCLPDLFAGKISAVLCRQWKHRVKGRDWYDFLWFIQRQVPVNLNHLEQRLRQFNYYKDEIPLSHTNLQQLLQQKVDKLNVELAKQDIIKFIKSPQELDGWSKELFHAAVLQLH